MCAVDEAAGVDVVDFVADPVVGVLIIADADGLGNEDNDTVPCGIMLVDIDIARRNMDLLVSSVADAVNLDVV